MEIFFIVKVTKLFFLQQIPNLNVTEHNIYGIYICTIITTDKSTRKIEKKYETVDQSLLI